MINMITIVGARPQFIKSAVLSNAIRRHNNLGGIRISEKILHTGQHFDFDMSGNFFQELEIPDPRYNLGINGGSHGAMTGQMLEKIERVLMDEKPDLVMVFGDTNSTLAGALAACKLRIPVAHVEAGLRSFNSDMPEEVNRVLTDRISSYLFCPANNAVANLENEGIVEGVVNSGDVMYDAILTYRESARKNCSLKQWKIQSKQYALCTIHRAENADSKQRLASLLKAVSIIAKQMVVVLPLHPRTKNNIDSQNLGSLLTNIVIIKPVSYLEMMRLEIGACVIITDSGGVQKEAFFHRIPCLTIRDETEWVETVELGWNVVCGASEERILRSWKELTDMEMQEGAPYGDGCASERIVKHIANIF